MACSSITAVRWLVEVAINTRAGIDWVMTQTINAPSVDVERVLKRAERVTTEVSSRRDEFHIETPWPALTRLIHDACGTQFGEPLVDLEIGFWDAFSVDASHGGSAGGSRRVSTTWNPDGRGEQFIIWSTHDQARARETWAGG